jgi:manganese transport protein
LASIETAYQTLNSLLGPAAKYVFGISLLASGLSSSAVGTMSGQVIMQGFLNFHIAVWLRRVLTMAPALVIILMGLDPTRSLVISQVILSFGLPFAVIPLVLFTARGSIMGPLVNKPLTTAAASLVALLILGLNFYLLWQTFRGG